MLTHEQIWKGIDRLAETCGFSTSGLARRAGLDPTTFNRSKRFANDGKERWPSTESIAKILNVTGTTLGDFLSLVDPRKGNAKTGTAPRILPMIGLAQAGKNGYFDDNGLPQGNGWDEIQFPTLGAASDQPLYALEVSGESMLPVYRPGDILVVAPGAPARRGDRVVLKTNKGEVMAKELARQTATRVDLKSLNPDHSDVQLATDDIAWLARVMWVSQ